MDPADELEVEEDVQSGGGVVLLDMMWVHAQPTACQHSDRCVMDSIVVQRAGEASRFDYIQQGLTVWH